MALEVGFDALEVGDGFVEAGEMPFDFSDDSALLVCLGKRDLVRRELIEVDPRTVTGV
jgi:hypothetical protein